MPALRTDGAGGGYAVEPVRVADGPDGDFRLLSIDELYPRLMLEDEKSIDRAAMGWDAVGREYFGTASSLRSAMSPLADAWRSDAATLLGERVEAAAASFDEWGRIAVARAYDLMDLAAVVRDKKARLAELRDEFHRATGVLLTPPADLTLDQRQEWRSQASTAAALDVNMRTYTRRALDEVVNPLANRFSEAALAFAATGPVYGGPTNAAVPSDAAMFALFDGGWLPDAASAPPVPAVPGAPTLRSVPAAPAVPDVAQVPVVPAVPLPPSVLATSVPVAPGLVVGGRRGVVPPGVTAFPQLSLVPGVAGTAFASLSGRQAALAAVPAPPVVAQAPSAAARAMHLPAAAAPSPGEAPGAPARPSAPGGTGTPGGPRGSAPPVPRLPGRTGEPGIPSGPPAPTVGRPTGTPPQLGGRTTRSTASEPSRLGTTAGPHLHGRSTAGPSSTPAPPPPTLGARRPPVREHGSGVDVRPPGRPATGLPGVGRSAHDPTVPPSLRSGRAAPARRDAGHPTGPTRGRHAAPTPDDGLPVGRSGHRRRRDEEVQTRHGGQAEPVGAAELGGRSSPVDTPPTAADQRAADRARRRAEWDAARREHQASSPVTP